MIVSNKHGLFLHTISLPNAELAKHVFDLSLGWPFESPTYNLENRPQASSLRAGATSKPQLRALFVNVLNRSGKFDTYTRTDHVEERVAPEAHLWQLDRADRKMPYTSGDNQGVSR